MAGRPGPGCCCAGAAGQRSVGPRKLRFVEWNEESAGRPPRVGAADTLAVEQARFDGNGGVTSEVNDRPAFIHRQIDRGLDDGNLVTGFASVPVVGGKGGFVRMPSPRRLLASRDARGRLVAARPALRKHQVPPQRQTAGDQRIQAQRATADGTQPHSHTPRNRLPPRTEGGNTK